MLKTFIGTDYKERIVIGGCNSLELSNLSRPWINSYVEKNQDIIAFQDDQFISKNLLIECDENLLTLIYSNPPKIPSEGKNTV